MQKGKKVEFKDSVHTGTRGKADRQNNWGNIQFKQASERDKVQAPTKNRVKSQVHTDPRSWEQTKQVPDLDWG